MNVEDRARQFHSMESLALVAESICDEFRHDISVIHDAVQQLKDHLQQVGDGTSAVDAIAGALKRATSLTDQLQALSRRQTKGRDIQDSNHIVRRMWQESPQKNTIINLSPEPQQVKVDSDQIEEMLTHLMNRVQKGMTEGGRLLIETGSVYLERGADRETPLPPGTYATITIMETREGVDVDDPEHVFKLLTTETKSGEISLGLIVAQHIALQHGGDVSVESTMGNIQRVTVFLPLVDERATVKPSDTDMADLVGGSEGVLLVSVDTGARDTIRDSLEAKGYRVITASDGKSAIKQSFETVEDLKLLVCDWKLPDMLGLELLHKVLRRRSKIRPLYIWHDNTACNHPDASKDPEVIISPFTSSQLLERVRQRLDDIA